MVSAGRRSKVGAVRHALSSPRRHGARFCAAVRERVWIGSRRGAPCGEVICEYEGTAACAFRLRLPCAAARRCVLMEVEKTLFCPSMSAQKSRDSAYAHMLLLLLHETCSPNARLYAAFRHDVAATANDYMFFLQRARRCACAVRCVRMNRARRWSMSG